MVIRRKRKYSFLPKRIVGLDLSVNHFGICCIDPSNFNAIISISYLTNKKKFLPKKGSNGKVISYFFAPKLKTEDNDIYESKRRSTILYAIQDFFVRNGLGLHFKDVYICIEDYAKGATSRGTYQIGEMGGLVKNYFWEKGFKLRKISPNTLKLWATGDGGAFKSSMLKTAKKWGFEPYYDEHLLETKKKGKDKSIDADGPITDMCESYLLALFLRQELDLRSGEQELKKLPQYQRTVFLRTTKAQPVNILAIPFICQER